MLPTDDLEVTYRVICNECSTYAAASLLAPRRMYTIDKLMIPFTASSVIDCKRAGI